MISQALLELAPKLTDFTPLELNPQRFIGKPDTLGKKYSRNLWAITRKWISGNPMRKLLAGQPAEIQRIDAMRFRDLRILLIGQSAIEPVQDDLTHGTLFIVEVGSMDVNDSGRLEAFKGARVARLDATLGMAWQEVQDGLVFVDVTDTFWRLYLQYGMCFMLGMKTSQHNWEYVTANSRRCMHCDVWANAGSTFTNRQTKTNLLSIPGVRRGDQPRVRVQSRVHEQVQAREWTTIMPLQLSLNRGRQMILAHVFRKHLN